MSVASLSMVEMVGWLLVHSVWQITVLAVLAWGLRSCFSSAVARYVVQVALLFAIPFGAVGTWLLWPARGPMQFSEASPNVARTTLPSPPENRLPSERPSSLDALREAREPLLFEKQIGSVTATQRDSASTWDSIHVVLQPWLPTLVACWCCGVLLCASRPLLGWWTIQRLRRLEVSESPPELACLLGALRKRMRIRASVALRVSQRIRAPLLVGYVRPMILLPAALVSQLPHPQLEALLAHELAHVRRHDFAVNLLQAVVETVFFYHPATWWLSNQIRKERENCCDDLAVAVVEQPLQLGRAILALAEFQDARPVLAMGAASGSLLARVQRIVEPPRQQSGIRNLVGVVLIGVALCGLLASLVAISRADNTQGSWGPLQHGLRCQLTLGESVDNTYSDLASVPFVVKLENASAAAISLFTGQRVGGTGHDDFYAPHVFEFEFLDEAQRPVLRTQREFVPIIQASILGASHRERLEPGEHLRLRLRPAHWHEPMTHRLPAGRYQVRVRYSGPSKAVDAELQKHFPQIKDSAWQHEVVSAWRPLTLTKSPPQSKLVWGPEKNGLRAAIGFQWSAEQLADPTRPPGIPPQTPLGIAIHVKNVTDQRISFVSEAGRQGDRCRIIAPDGRKTEFRPPFLTGVPIDVRWILRPGQIARLSILASPIPTLKTGGQYQLKYVVRFNSRQSRDAEGNITFPAPGDYQSELPTGTCTVIVQGADPQTQRPPSPAEAQEMWKRVGIRANVETNDGFRSLTPEDNFERRVTLYFSGRKVTDEWMPYLLAYPELTDLSFSASTQITDETLAIIGKLKNLRRLRISSSEIVGDQLHQLAGCEKLSTLQITSSKLKDESLQALDKLAGLELTSLSVGGRNCSDRGLKHVGQLSRLQELRLQLGRTPTGDALVSGQTMQALRGMQELRVLEIMGNDIRLHAAIDDQDLAVLATLPQLQELTLSSRLITDAGLKQVAKCESLKWLSIWHAPVTDAGLTHLGHLNALESLHLFGTQVTGTGLQHFVHRNEERKHLSMLSLLGVHATDKGLAAIAQLPRLRYLRIGPHGWFDKDRQDMLDVTDEGLKQLATMSALGSLELSRLQVTDQGITALRGMPALRNLKLDDLPITDDSLKELAASKFISLELEDCLALTTAAIENLHRSRPACRITVLRDGRQVGTLHHEFVKWSPLRAESREKQTPAEDVSQKSSTVEASVPPLERRISLDLEKTPLRHALQQTAAAVGLEIEFQEAALQQTGIDLAKEITRQFTSQTAGAIVTQLVEPRKHFGVLPVVRGQRLVVSTLTAWHAHNRAALPKWLQAVYNRGVLLRLNDRNEVITLTAGAAFTPELLQRLPELKNLRELELGGCQLTADSLVALRDIKSLERLSGHDLFDGTEGLGDAIIRNVQELPRLQSLALTECGTTDAGVAGLRSLPQLRQLSLRQEGRLTDRCLVTIGQLNELTELKLNSYVATQRLGRMQFSGDAIQRLEPLKKLRALELVGHSVQPKLLDLPLLESLSLGSATVDDTCAEAIGKLAKLRSLTLVYPGLSDLGMQHLGNLTQLRRLSLSSFAVGDDGVQVVVRLPHLQHIELRAAKISDKALTHLSQVKSLTRLDLHGSGQPGTVRGSLFSMGGVAQLQSLPNLRVLWINNLHSQGGFRELKGLAQLHQLTLAMTNVRRDELEFLQEAMPNTVIVASGGGMDWPILGIK